jgi:hypothetical protein
MHDMLKLVVPSLEAHVNGFMSPVVQEGCLCGTSGWYLCKMEDAPMDSLSETAHGKIRLRWLVCSQSNLTAGALCG